MDERFIDPNYEFEAPQFVNFCNGLDDEDPDIDAWFDGKPDDEGGVQIPIDVDETELKKESDPHRPKRKIVMIPQQECPIASTCEPKATPFETKNTEKTVESTKATKMGQIQSDDKVQNIKDILILETKQTTDSDREAVCIQPTRQPENDTDLKSFDSTENTVSEKVELGKNEIDSVENIDQQANVETAEKSKVEIVEGSECLAGEKAESDVDSQKEGQTNSSANSDTAEEGQNSKPREKEKRATRASKRHRSIDSIGTGDGPNKKKKQMAASGGNTQKKRARSICCNPEIKSHPITIPVTPQCLKRQKTNNPSMIKLKTTEELEMECIAKLRKKTKHHIQVNENMMKKAISCPAVNAVRAIGTSLTRPQEFHFQTDKRVKQHPMTTRADQPDLNGEDAEKGFWNSLRQHPPSPTWKNRAVTKPKPFNLSDGGQRKRKRSALDKDVSETDSYQSMAYQVYKFQTTTPPRFRTRKANDSGFKGDNDDIEGGHEKAVASMAKPVTMPKTPNLSTKTRSRPLAEGVLSKEEREEKEMEEIKNYKFKAKPFDRRIVECEGTYGVKIPEERTAVTEPRPFVFESDERLAARKDKVTEDQEQTVNFKALPQPSFEKVFRPQLKHERTEPKPFSFEGKDKERWQKKEDKIQEVFKEEEKLREFRAQPLPSDSPDHLPAVSSKCGTSIKPFALNTENRGARKAEKWIQKVKSEIEENRNKAMFKAKPCKVVHDAPFVPQKSKKPLTEISEFALNTNHRAERREELETHKKEREQIDEELRREREAEREREEQRALVILRKQMVHKAQPIHRYKNVKIKPSDQPLTEAHSPVWSEMKRRRVENHR